MGDQADLWDFGTIRRDLPRQGTVNRAPPPMPSIPSSSSSRHLPPTANHPPQKTSISRGSANRFGSITSSRSSASTARGGSNPPPTADQFPAPPQAHSQHAPPPRSPTKQHQKPQALPVEAESGTNAKNGGSGSTGSGFDTIRFAGDIAEQQARVEKGLWTDARGQEGGEYDSDEDRDLEPGEEVYEEGHQRQHDEDLDDSRAILEDVVVPVIESVSTEPGRRNGTTCELTHYGLCTRRLLNECRTTRLDRCSLT